MLVFGHFVFVYFVSGFDATGTTHRTFEQAARARGLLDGLGEYEFLFEDYAESAARGLVTAVQPLRASRSAREVTPAGRWGLARPSLRLCTIVNPFRSYQLA
eukprot:SAG25_NODE_840_length_5120_cov_3.796455_1_plen_101_part_10